MDNSIVKCIHYKVVDSLLLLFVIPNTYSNNPIEHITIGKYFFNLINLGTTI